MGIGGVVTSKLALPNPKASPPDALSAQLAMTPKIKIGDSTLLGLENNLIAHNIYGANYNNPLRKEASQFGEASMQERQNRSQLQWFDQYRASKTVLFWGCAGSVALATIVGFSWGGWVTSGSAQKMAEQAAAQARQEVAAIVCVDRFMAAPDAGVQLTALKEITSSYAQSKFVQDGGWVMVMPASGSADGRKAAGLCAEELAKREVPTTGEAARINDETTVAQ